MLHNSGFRAWTHDKIILHSNNHHIRTQHMRFSHKRNTWKKNFFLQNFQILKTYSLQSEIFFYKMFSDHAQTSPKYVSEHSPQL